VLFSTLIPVIRILEYLNREDADRAVKELDSRDLRGQPVRVSLFEDVSILLSTGDAFSMFWVARPRQLSP
jgi:hypothetical protein